MPHTRSPRRARLAAIASAALALTGLQFLIAAPAAQAAPSTTLVIAEFYGNGGNSGAVRNADFIELWNMSGSSIDLSAYSVQYRSTSSVTTASGAAPLSGTIAAGGRFLVRLSNTTANGTGLPTPDYIATGVSAGGTNGQIFLVNGTTAINPGAAGHIDNPAVVDFVGFGTAVSFETAAATGVSDNTKSFTRSNLAVDGNNNSTDFTATTPTPQNAAGETEPALAITTIPAKSGTVSSPITPFTAVATGGTGPYTWSANGTLPSGVSIDGTTGEVTGTPDTANVYNVVLTVTDSAAPTAGTDTEAFTFTVSAAPTGPTAIADIQGSTGTSPLAGQPVVAQGVVTAKYPTGGFNGFYLQTPGADATPGKSDAIFVFTPSFDDSTLTIGDSVEVAGDVSEFTTSGANTLTEITATSVTGIASLGTVVANTVIPGTDCALPGTACPSLAAADTAKEEFEGEVFQPSGTWTVTDAYDGSATNPSGSTSSSFFGELGLAANSTLPLIAPTELIDASNTAGIADRTAYNNGHRVVLDDGSSRTFWNTTNDAANQNDPLPWFTQSHQVRVGAQVTFPQPVILENRFGWKIQPTTTVSGAPTVGQQPQFEQDRPATPAAVSGDLQLATFNVLNYFTTLGGDTAGCTPFNDRAGNPIAVNSCTGNGPRGAWNTANFLRQQEKIVNAINTMDADIVSLEEIENSRKVDSADRDEAIGALVAALNADAGETRWAFVPSPTTLPTVAEEDVIRTGFIYDPDTVDVIGNARVLVGSTPFNNAREPFAAAFKAEGADDDQGFAVVVNHFKSKGASGATGDNVDTGQGAYNGDRTRQAQALKTFANEFAAARGVKAIFLTGDFNAYSEEDPVQVFTDDVVAPWTNLESTDDPDEESYSFDGASGSLDHVIANAAAEDLVTGVDIWEINGNETVFNQYSRYNYVGTDLYNPGPFSASDHNPEIIGINTPAAATGTTDVQILGTNDFHGRIANDPASAAAGAGVIAGAVEELRGQNPNTVFAAAGDLIGASTFESFILNDKPTIDALNEAGLDVSSVGNHEFDQGYDDLVNRVMADYDATTNPEGGAEWAYLGANVRFKANDDPALPSTWTKDFGDIRVGFVGVVTEHLPELVSPGGIEDIKVTDIVDETNAAADDLVDNQNADIVVMLVHEGAPNTNCTTMDDDPSSDFGSIINGVNENVDAIVSGHTHLEYNCSFPVAAWAGRDVTERPVVSAGQYGAALNQIVFTVDDATGDVVAKSQGVLHLKNCTNSTACTNFDTDAPTQAIVDQAVSEAGVLGAVPLGQIAGPMKRGYLANGTTENRGVESTVGNLVAEAQRWQTSGPEAGSAQIAFMNPGGLRTDMLGVGTDPYPRTVTYKQAAEVQPFANGLVNMDLTGAQIKAALEQQWQPGGASRPFLKLGASKGFTYTSDPDAAQGSRITGMWLNGTAIDPVKVYSVTVNGFLATGGDNFTAFAGGTNKAEAGLTDLQAMVNYFDEFANTGEGDAPLPVPTKQNGVHVNFAPAAPATYAPGDHVTFDLSGWSFSNTTDPLDTEVVVKLAGTTLGTFPLSNTIQAALPGFDATGTASVDVVIPAGAPAGAKKLVLTGATTGTVMRVPVTISGNLQEVQILGTNDFHGRIAKDPASAAAGAGVLAGAVKQFRDENPDTVFAAAGDLIGASTFESFIQNDKPTIDALNEAGLDVSSVGNHEFDQGYDDLVNRVMADYDATTNPDGGAEWAYLGANVRFKANDNPALPATWTKDFGSVRVGFVGTVTEHLPELVSPGGIEDIKVTDIVAETNAAADDLVDNQGADIVVMLVHEGAPNTNCTTMDDDPSSDFGSIINGVNENVDAIISGHTHLEYNCSFPVAAWAGRDVTERPVVSAGQYGAALNRIVFTVDSTTGDVAAKAQSVVKLKTCAGAGGTACGGNGQPAWVEAFGTDGPTQTIVDQAVAKAAVLGAQPLGQIAGPIKRGYLANGTTENRGVESSLGNLVAEAQRWQTSGPEAGSAQIAFMNPGGLRTDMTGVGTDPYPRTVTFKQAAEVQPFANGLVNMDLTGAQIKAALEQQWQPGGASRPFLKLGASKGFTYTSDPDAAQGSRITGMWLDGVPIVPATVYSVTVNGFLATGGDNFAAFAGGTNKAEAGLTDLQAMVNYFDEFANTGEGDAPLPVPTKQNGVHVNFPPAAPASYGPGDHVTFDLSGWSFSNATDPLDTEVVVKLDAATLGTFPLSNTIQAALPGFDATGTASVDVVIPAGTPAGTIDLVLSGATTQTQIPVKVTVAGVQTITADDVAITFGEAADLVATVAGNHGVPTGTVEFFSGSDSLGSAPLVSGTATLTLAPRSMPAGTRTITAVYSGGGGYTAGEAEFDLTVAKAPVTVTADDTSVAVGADGTVHVTVTSTAGVNPTGLVEVYDGATLLGSKALSSGAADVPVDSSSLAIGAHTLTASYGGNVNFLDGEDDLVLTVGKATSSLAVSAPTMTYGQPSTVTVAVSTSGGPAPTGTVEVRQGATVLGAGPVAGGSASITLAARSLTPGTTPLTAVYSGDANVTGASTAFSQTVVKAISKVTVDVKPGTITAKKTKAKIVVKVDAVGVDPVTGKVKITVEGRGTFTLDLENGKAVLKLEVFKKAGKRDVTVKYLGNSLVEGDAAKDVINVKP